MRGNVGPVARMSASDIRGHATTPSPDVASLIRATLRDKPVARMSAAICGATRGP
jgi:hypothetical protein